MRASHLELFEQPAIRVFQSLFISENLEAATPEPVEVSSNTRRLTTHRFDDIARDRKTGCLNFLNWLVE
jgi:hypothetical protein